jgi:hypothetical protein
MRRKPRPHLIDFLLIFAIVFGIHVRGGIDTALLIELAIVVAWVFRPRMPRGAAFAVLSGILLLLFEYAVVIYLINGAIDLYFPMRFFRALVEFIAVAWIFQTIVERRRLTSDTTWSYFSDIYLLLMVTQALVAFGEYLNPPFALFMYRNWIDYPLDRIAPHRALGLTTAAAMPSYLHVVGFYVACDKIARGYSSFSPRLLSLMGVTSLAATFLMAQTGVVLFALATVPFFLLLPAPRVARVLWFLSPLILVAVIGAGWYWEHKMDPDQQQLVTETLVSKTDFITNFVDYGHVGNNSFDALMTMYFLPSSFGDLLFGNSLGLRLGDPSDPLDRLRANTDVGYVMDLAGIGIVGTLLSLSFYSVILLVGIDSLLWKRRVDGALLLVIVTLFFLIGHAKEVHLFTRSGFEFLLLMFWSVHRSRQPLPASRRLPARSVPAPRSLLAGGAA